MNADDARQVGEKILASMADHTVAEHKFSKKNQVKTLASATHIKTPSGEPIELDPQVLYQRFIVTGIDKMPLPELLDHELCAFPPSLFDNNMRMRVGDKAELIHQLLKTAPSCIVALNLIPDLYFIIDAGRLLHRFTWPKHSTYSSISGMYVRHIHKNYHDDALVVFDGYLEASTKDEVHRRRQGLEVGASVSVARDLQTTMSKKAFLANPSNKQALINLLSEDMQESGISTVHAEGDADYKIAMLACTSALTRPTASVADDTDIFQLMVNHAPIGPNSKPLYMLTESRAICISLLKRCLDPVLCASLFFIHGISGCDTTSRPFGIGKGTVLSKYKALAEYAPVFMSESSSKEDIESAGQKALLVMYGSKSKDLNTARAEIFQVKVATSSGIVSPEKLPPTADAAALHSLRVYHQVQAWRGVDLRPEYWGWKRTDSGFVPIRLTKAAAPEHLLKIIRCNCGGKCDSKRCTCHKNGLMCTAACGQCKGITCSNRHPVTTEEDIE